MKQPDFYKLNLSYADLNGTYSDAYLQIDISFYYKTYSGGYNYSDLFFAEYHNDTGWFIRTTEGEKFQQEKKRLDFLIVSKMSSKFFRIAM